MGPGSAVLDVTYESYGDAIFFRKGSQQFSVREGLFDFTDLQFCEFCFPMAFSPQYRFGMLAGPVLVAYCGELFGVSFSAASFAPSGIAIFVSVS